MMRNRPPCVHISGGHAFIRRRTRDSTMLSCARPKSTSRMLRRGGYMTIVTFSEAGILAFCFTSSSARSMPPNSSTRSRSFGLVAQPHAALRQRLDLIERAAARLRHFGHEVVIVGVDAFLQLGQFHGRKIAVISESMSAKRPRAMVSLVTPNLSYSPCISGLPNTTPMEPVSVPG